MKKIVYYTQVFYLDAALEYISLASRTYDFHVFIEITPEALKANIFELEVDLNKYDLLVDFSSVAQEWNLLQLEKYFVFCKSVQFVVHPHRKSLSPSSFFRSLAFSKRVLEIKPNFIQFEDVSLRTIGLIPIIWWNRKAVIMNVHDPKPHTGEVNAKKELAKKVFFRIVNKFVCFSNHSCAELASTITKNKQISLVRLLPYSYYNQFGCGKSESIERKHVTFVGRISKYKGVELFLQSIPKILKAHPEQQFCIAGKLIRGYDLKIQRYAVENLELITGHLSNEKLVRVIKSSKVIVCPYLDATQSGVLMTAYALGCPVIVTPVGGLSEYALKDKSSLVTTDVTEHSLANTIISFLNKSDEEQKLKIDIEELKKHNLRTFKQLYGG